MGMLKEVFLQKYSVFSGKDKILIPLFAISIVLIGYIMGHFVALLLVVAMIFIIALADYFVRKYYKKEDVKLKDPIYAITFATLVSMIFAIILPYILFHDFTNIFVIQYIYAFPVLLIFLASLYFFEDLIMQKKINLKRMSHALTIAVVASVAISILLIIGSLYFYNFKADDYSEGYQKQISLLKQDVQTQYPDLPVFNELTSFEEEFMLKSAQKSAEFSSFDREKVLCITSRCLRVTVDRSYHLITMVVENAIRTGLLQQAQREYDYIMSGNYTSEFRSLQAYSEYLKAKVDSSGYTLPGLNQEQESILQIMEMHFTYNDIENIIERRERERGSQIESLVHIYEGRIFDTDSWFFNSMAHILQHSDLNKEGTRLIVKVAIYTSTIAENNEIVALMFNNRNIEEPVESKAIRNKILSHRIDQFT